MPYYLLIIISYIHFFHIHSCKCIHRHENDHFEPTRFIKEIKHSLIGKCHTPPRKLPQNRIAEYNQSYEITLLIQSMPFC